jgi:hypothetical protein
MKGMVNGDGGMAISSANFCPRVVATNLPWTAEPLSHDPDNAFAIMSISIKGFSCGATDVPFRLKKENILWESSLPFADECFLYGGNGTSTPRIEVLN